MRYKLFVMMTVMMLVVTACSSGQEASPINSNAQETQQKPEGNSDGSETGERPEGEKPEGVQEGERPVGMSGEEMPEGGQAGERPGGTGSGEAAGTAVSVEVAEIDLQAISDELRVLGVVMPSEETVIGASASGTVDQLLVSVGDAVSEGDLLYTMDDDDIRSSSSQQRAVSSNALATAKYNYEKALDAYEEQKVLFENNLATGQTLETYEEALESARLAYQSAQTNYSNTVTSSSQSLDDYAVTSPVNGVVSAVDVGVGEMSSGSDITIINTDYLLIETLVSGNMLDDMVIGKEAVLIYDDMSLTGTIEEVDQVGIDGTDSFTVKIGYDNTEGILKPGFRVYVYFSVDETEDQVVVPKKTVLTDAYGDYVYLIEKDTAVKTYIEQGLTSNGYVQLIGDVKQGDVVVITGQYQLQDGDQVSVQ